METKNADQHGSSAYGIGDEPTVNTSGGDGCGFSALRQRKRRTESENDAEVEPVIEEDGTACKRSSGDHGPSEKVSAAPQIPEYVWFNMFDVVCVCVCVIFGMPYYVSLMELSNNAGATPSRTQHPASAQVLGLKPWSPSTFQPWLRPWPLLLATLHRVWLIGPIVVQC